MSSENFTWITTDRKTEAEVLNELAKVDTPRVIISRDIPDERTTLHFNTLLRLDSTPTTQSAGFLDVPRNELSSMHLLPLDLLQYIASAWDACFFVENREKSTTIERIDPRDSFDDWILRRRLSGEWIDVLTLEVEPDAYRALRDRSHRALIASHPNLSPYFRTQIDRLAGLNPPAGSVEGVALRAGIYLWHDAMDESHELAQSIEGQGRDFNGDYVHAILHHREPDYGNAKYWFRRVGRHPSFSPLGLAAGSLLDRHAPAWKDRLLKSGWDPFAFADFCEQAVATKNSNWIECAETIQEIEMLLLLGNTHHACKFETKAR